MSYETPESPQGSYPPQDPYGPGPQTSDERMWAMLCHIAGLALYTPVPFGNIIGPLIVWLIKKDEYPFVDDQGKESLNFQISITLYLVISAVLVLALIGILLLIAVTIFDLVVIIIAAVKANQGIAYRYPLCIRFIA